MNHVKTMTAQFFLLSSKQPNGRTGSIRAFIFFQDEGRKRNAREREKEKKPTIERTRPRCRRREMNARRQLMFSIGQNLFARKKAIETNKSTPTVLMWTE